MILQALTDYYKALSAEGVLEPMGWSPEKVSFAICLNDDGSIDAINDIRTQQLSGKKTVLAARRLSLPAHTKRAVNIAANFLCDNSAYLLGLDSKGKPERTKKCYEASKELHLRLLKDLSSPAAQAVVRFFEAWEPEHAQDVPEVAEHMEDILSGANLIFEVGGRFVHEDSEIRLVWEREFAAQGDGPQMVCLVTGETGPVERLHPAIKNVAGAQSSGASIVSFNAPAFCSYGKEQSFNAPTGKFAAFAYAAALNHLLTKRETVFKIGDATVVFWAKNGRNAYQDIFSGLVFGSAVPSYTAKELADFMKSLCAGKHVTFEEDMLDPDMDFYVLGLSPNAARLSVRFFLHNSFGTFLRSVQAHQERLEIERPSFDARDNLSLWELLDETVNQNSRDKSPAPNLAGETLRAILNDTPYPATLLQGVMLRIRAERKVSRGRAAIIKAYYLKNNHPDVPKEVLTVSLNQSSKNVPYVLGRLFAVLEGIQSAANPGINTTIKDKYFSSASATPAQVFPLLINLAQKHLKKLSAGQRIYYDTQISELMNLLEDSFPQRMNQPMQGAFLLGYYHQIQYRYTKKEDK